MDKLTFYGVLVGLILCALGFSAVVIQAWGFAVGVPACLATVFVAYLTSK